MDRNNHIEEQESEAQEMGTGGETARGEARGRMRTGVREKKKSSVKIIITVAVFVLLFAGGIGSGYIFFLSKAQKSPDVSAADINRQRGDLTEIVVFFPSEGRLKSESRQVDSALSKIAVARATLEEFLKGPEEDMKSYVPEGARLLGIYDGADGVLYIDISDSFRRNLKVDAMAEFLLMRGLYESVLANVYGVADVKILIEGAEVETLGGHISLLRPLGDTVAQTIVEE